MDKSKTTRAARVKETGLVHYDAMCHAIEACADLFEDLKAIEDREEQLRICVSIARNTEPERQAVAIRLRAEKGFKRCRRELAALRTAALELSRMTPDERRAFAEWPPTA
jgi:hypothetical protein